MTTRRHWSILIALLLLLSLFLVACVRPLPGDNETPPTVTPAETGSSSQPETYPGPAAPEVEDSPAGYPADDAGNDNSTDLLQPEGEPEAYPGDETAESEIADGEAAEDEVAEGEATEGEAAEDEVAEGEATEGEAAEDEVAEGETTEGEAAEDEVAEGETTEGEAAEPTAVSEAVESEKTHTVAAGQTLYSIGMQHGLSWVAIAEANDISNPDSLYIGQVLIIPDVSAADTSESSDSSETAEAEETVGDAGDAEPAEETESVDPDSVEAPAEDVTYVVQSGDNLYQISLRFGVGMMDIARANDLANFDQVYAGQELIIPQDEIEEETTESSGQEAAHLVAEGETVFSIAFEYGISWTKLVEANEIVSPYTLEIGQSLVIPAGD